MHKKKTAFSNLIGTGGFCPNYRKETKIIIINMRGGGVMGWDVRVLNDTEWGIIIIIIINE